MFDVAPTELLLVAVVALVVIGPKDLPKAMRFVGYWVGRARGVMRQFRSGFDTMVREAELHDMEKKWAEENARIMREHPQPTPMISAPGDGAADTATDDDAPLMTAQPVMLDKPAVAEPSGVDPEPGISSEPIVADPAEGAVTESAEGAEPAARIKPRTGKKAQA